MAKLAIPAVFMLFVASLFFPGGLSVGRAAESFPDIVLEVPDNDMHREYLGLTAKPGENFSIADIKADIVLIELFSMYCPYCQAEAPAVNEFHDLALQQQEKGIRVRVVGLGASNTQFEVEYFRDNFEVAFPLFPDKNLDMYKKLKGEGTPGFIGCVLKEGEDPKIILRESGGFESPQSFLDKLLKNAGYTGNG